MKNLIIIIHVAGLIILSPFVSGLIKKIKNNLRMRKGAPLLQPYYDLFKLLRKEEVISEHTSIIFTITPYIVLSSVIAAAFLVPFMHTGISLSVMGDFILFIFLLALGRFFLSLAGLDAGSSFGGMGSSREMFISSMVEPIALISIFTLSMNAGSTGLGILSSTYSLKLSTFIAGLSFLMITIAETSRIPVDNKETHLELTMVHEAMVLEYSGRSLALIELAAHIKQIVFFSIIANIIFPFGYMGMNTPISIITGIAVYAGKILILSLIISFIEVTTAKMRLFRVVDFLAFSLFFAAAAMTAASLGV